MGVHTDTANDSMSEDTNDLKHQKSSKIVAAVLFLLCAIPGLCGRFAISMVLGV